MIFAGYAWYSGCDMRDQCHRSQREDQKIQRLRERSTKIDAVSSRTQGQSVKTSHEVEMDITSLHSGLRPETNEGGRSSL